MPAEEDDEGGAGGGDAAGGADDAAADDGADGFDWPPHREAATLLLTQVLCADFRRLWQLGVPEEDFVAVFAKTGACEGCWVDGTPHERDRCPRAAPPSNSTT